MKQLLCVLACCFLAFCPVKDENRIAWSPDYKLSWSDFKAKSRVGNSYVASTNSGLSFKYSFKVVNGQATPDYTFEVTSYFYPDQSWFIPEEVNPRVLRHEQTHFDITELHARILRKRVSEFEFSSKIKKEFDALYDLVEQERRDMQAQFDLETDHSTIVLKEAAWEQKIAELLSQFEPWQ